VAKRLLFLAGVLAALSSCQSAEQAILITARAAGTGPTVIETVNVHVIPTTSPTAPYDTQSEPVHRTVDLINGDQPIRVAVRLHTWQPIMVHIVAVTAGGTHLYATRCYDPMGGVTHDEVLLVTTDAMVDADQDGWPDPAHVDATCRDPGAGSTGVACHAGLCPAATAGDCNDMPGTAPVDCATDHTSGECIYPGAPGVCGDGIDQDCRGNGLAGGNRDEPCGDMDGDGYQACGAMPTATCDCNDMNPNVHPGAMDICGNGIDEDCSGEPGGMGAFCDGDHDGFASNVDCNDADPNIHPGPITLEHCDTMTCGMACRMGATGCMCDGVDNNCNGLIDEDPSCRSPDLDGDGHDACTTGMTDCSTCDCNDCDSGIHPGARDFCGNGIDEDGVGGDSACAAGDTDRDGATGGMDCNEGDPHVHVDAPENCNTPTSESCGTMTCPAAVDADHDGFAAASVMGSDCDDMDGMVNPWTVTDQSVSPFAFEACDGIDNNCNGINDEVLDPMAATPRTGCVVTDPTDPAQASCMTSGATRCVVTFATNLHHCGHCRNECNTGATLVADQCVGGACSCSTNPSGAACNAGDTCCVSDAMGHMVAHPGCTNVQAGDVNNCGACGIACDPAVADSCAGGTCVCGATGGPCGTGQTCCGGQCVDLATDVNHCGSCARQCGGRTSCTAGTCGCDNPTLHGDCNGDIGRAGGNGCETDLQTDASHCGTCAQSCVIQHVASGVCTAGACVINTCQPLWDDCDRVSSNGCETDLSQTNHCGACSTVCTPMNATASCAVAGTTATCSYTSCTGNFGDCDGNRVNGCETSLRLVGTCGACGTSCTVNEVNATGPMCTMAGACDYGACTGSFSDCDGNRTNGCETAWSSTRCGGACTNCTTAAAHASGQSCTAGGTCDYTACSGSFSDCDANRANGCEQAWDVNHCGGCTACSSTVMNASTLSCMSGTCNYGTCNAGFSDCDGNRANGCEVTQSTMQCGSACTNCNSTVLNASTPSCSSGTCNYASCSAGFSDCDMNRANGCETAQSAMACGASCTNCGTTTLNATGRTCSMGSCDYTSCNAGFVECDGNRANGCEQAQNATHCGASCTNCMGSIMNATPICTAGGACDYSTCNAGFVDCDGNRANGCEMAQSATACGSSCTDCTALSNVSTATCTAGACVITACQGSRGNCDGMVSNGCESMNTMNGNCCGAMCTMSQSCTAGTNGVFSCM
jgi:hypothetical protein